MPCYRPLPGIDTGAIRVDTGKRIIKILPREAWLSYNPKTDQVKENAFLRLPCGQCIGCRLERSRQWAVRCVHESTLYKKNCFITLTYNNENLPAGGSLIKSDFQKFMKRLRKRFSADSTSRIRYYMCGEYGEKFQRPHYHALLFNFDLPDREYWRRSGAGEKLYVSQILNEVWGHGFTSVGEATFESAAYVARYICKKISGPLALDHYNMIDKETGEILSERIPEYNCMSRRPGIALGWLEKNVGDVYPGDFVLMKRGEVYKKCKPPKYYDSKYEIFSPDEHALIKEARKSKSKQHAENNTFSRLAIREEVQTIKANTLIRSYEK